MKSLYKRLVAVVLALVSLFCIGGVSAAWVYADGPISPIQQLLDIGIWNWTETPGGDQGDETKEEAALREAFADILNDVDDTKISGETGEFAQYNDMTKQEAFEAIIEERKNDDGNGWYSKAPGEVGADDPDAEYLRKLLNIPNDSELSVMIKFVSGGVGYELYTTRVDVDAKDANGNYVFSDDEVTKQNHYIYPVNKTTFVETSSGIVEDKISVGYSRVLWYWDTGVSQTKTIRSFDVSQWAEGTSSDPVEVDRDDASNGIYIYSDIGQMETTVYFRYGNYSGNTFNAANFPNETGTVTSVTAGIADGTYSFKRSGNTGNARQTATLVYTPDSKNPSTTNANAIKIVL